MDKAKTVAAFLEKQEQWKAELAKLQEILGSTEMAEAVKWGIPVYSINGKNVVGIAGFKDHFALWFYQGVFLKDKHNKLINAQEGTTKALRQWRFSSMDEIDEKLILEYVQEAIKNQKEGKEIKPEKKKDIPLPEELDMAFRQDSSLKAAFEQLTPGKQREYLEHIGGAKQAKTRQTRLEKAIPLIKSGSGLHDKYIRR